MWKPQFSSLYQDFGRGFVITEAEHLQIVHLAQRDIDRKLIGERRFLVRGIRQKIERMRIATSPCCSMREIGNHGIRRK